MSRGFNIEFERHIREIRKGSHPVIKVKRGFHYHIGLVIKKMQMIKMIKMINTIAAGGFYQN